MAGAPAPEFLPEPFANDATVGTSPGGKNIPIPDAQPGSPANAASWQDGFNANTMTPEVSGGLPPLGWDFNGILFTITSHLYALEAGQPYTFNATLADDLGGYAAGAMVGMADGTGFWFNPTAGTATNPDTGAPGAWVPGFTYGVSYITALTGGVVTLTAAQAKRDVIVLSGALASNLTVVLPTWQRKWLIVNATSGAFSTTVQTAGGTGVAVPQGGNSSPLPVWGDGTNIYFGVTQLAVSYDQNPTPLTLVERTNAGYVFATYFNQNSAYETLTPTGVWYEANGDGYHRKMTWANFTTQLFNSPALTGNPTAPTQAVGDSSTKLATTAFANPGQLAATNGWVKLPGGIIFQWGRIVKTASATNYAVGFPIVFPNVVLSVNISESTDNNGYIQRVTPGSLVNSGFTLTPDTFNSAANPTTTVLWWAVGN